MKEKENIKEELRLLDQEISLFIGMNRIKPYWGAMDKIPGRKNQYWDMQGNVVNGFYPGDDEITQSEIYDRMMRILYFASKKKFTQCLLYNLYFVDDLVISALGIKYVFVSNENEKMHPQIFAWMKSDKSLIEFLKDITKDFKNG